MSESQIFGICPACKENVTEDDHIQRRYLKVEVLGQERITRTHGETHNLKVVLHNKCEHFMGLIPRQCFLALPRPCYLAR